MLSSRDTLAQNLFHLCSAVGSLPSELWRFGLVCRLRHHLKRIGAQFLFLCKSSWNSKFCLETIKSMESRILRSEEWMALILWVSPSWVQMTSCSNIFSTFWWNSRGHSHYEFFPEWKRLASTDIYIWQRSCVCLWYHHYLVELSTYPNWRLDQDSSWYFRNPLVVVCIIEFSKAHYLYRFSIFPWCNHLNIFHRSSLHFLWTFYCLLQHFWIRLTSNSNGICVEQIAEYNPGWGWRWSCSIW